jgi:flavin reductase (DIM6/NTAB) family NADH-FMN oxidoreductase RutF
LKEENMAKIRQEGAGEFYHFYPRLATVVTVRAKDKQNAMAVAWGCPISFAPPIYGVSISPKRYTHGLILEAGEFAVNFLPIEARKLIAAVGRTSGREVNKFERFKIEVEEPLKLRSPILKAAYAAYECKLLEHRRWGDHDWFAGEVVAAHYEEGVFSKEGVIDLERVTPAMYLGSDLYLEFSPKAVHHIGREEALRA